MSTEKQYDDQLALCRQLFSKKSLDYGSSWRIMRLPSLTDQLFIKAQRIRHLEESTVRMVDDDEVTEFMGIVNYAIISLIQCELGVVSLPDLNHKEALAAYDKAAESTKKLMLAKNHDYEEVWRKMRVSSLTDLILQKLLRIKMIEDNNGQTLVSEGIKANYQDILNYAIFALIHLKELEV